MSSIFATKIDEIKFTFCDDPTKSDDAIIVTLPCGCAAHLMSKAAGGVNQFGNPIQFTTYCRDHFDW